MLRSWVRSPSSPPAKHRIAKHICFAIFLFSNALLELLAECASQAHITHRAVLDLVDAPRPAGIAAPICLPRHRQPTDSSVTLEATDARGHRCITVEPAQITERALLSNLVFGPYSSAFASTATGSSVTSSSIKLPNRGWPS